jgi:hypothetical protein
MNMGQETEMLFWLSQLWTLLQRMQVHKEMWRERV